MIIIDKNISGKLGHYIFQCALATASLFVILLFLNVLKETAIIASLASSAFVVFTMPKTYSSHPRRLIGGYIIGLTVGIIFYIISNSFDSTSLFSNERITNIIFGALSVGVAIFLMALTNTEHAPAAGVTLGLLLNEWDYTTPLFIIGAVLWMAVIHHALRPLLIDLTSTQKNEK